MTLRLDDYAVDDTTYFLLVQRNQIPHFAALASSAVA